MHAEYTGVVYGEGVGCPPFIGGRVWKREEIFFYFVVEYSKCVFWCILLPICVCFSTVLRPGSHLQYAYPVCRFRLTLAQSKVLEILQKKTLNIIFHGGEYATNLKIIIQRRNTKKMDRRPGGLMQGRYLHLVQTGGEVSL